MVSKENKSLFQTISFSDFKSILANLPFFTEHSSVLAFFIILGKIPYFIIHIP